MGFNKTFKRIFFSLFFTISSLICAAQAAPQLVQYTGLLTDDSGLPLANGTYQITFTLYDANSNGNELWQELWDGSDASHPKVSVLNGRFMVLLGSNSADGLPSSIFQDGDQAFLGIRVENDPEMVPRQQISSVPYSLASDDGVPKGGIIMWSGATDEIPDGWVLCDGDNGTPNLSDRFVLSSGSVYAVGSTGGASSHTLTLAETPSHSHVIDPPATSSASAGNHRHTLANSAWAHRNVSGSQWHHERDSGDHFFGITHERYTDYAGNHSHSGNIAPFNSSSVGSTAPHNNMPPFYALAFIMKL